LEDLAQHILDIASNSLEAGATFLGITIFENTRSNILDLKVVDNGPGISDADIQKVLDPFYTTKKHKRVGLGIPLLHEAVERCHGAFLIEALPKQGTMVRATFPHNHIDRAPLGDMAGTIISLLAGNSPLDLKYTHSYNGRTFSFDTRELGTPGEVVRTPRALVILERYLNENILKIRRVAKSEELGRAG